MSDPKYLRELCYDAHKKISEAVKVLRSIDNNISFVDDVYLQTTLTLSIIDQLEALSQSYYEAFKND